MAMVDMGRLRVDGFARALGSYDTDFAVAVEAV